jgi:hypothetical protein
VSEVWQPTTKPLHFNLKTNEIVMQKKILWFALILLASGTLQVKGKTARPDRTFRRWFIGNSLLILGNFDMVNNPAYVQLSQIMH